MCIHAYYALTYMHNVMHVCACWLNMMCENEHVGFTHVCWYAQCHACVCMLVEY